MGNPSKKTWTVLELIDWTKSYFTEKGIDSARLDAELLLARVLQVDRMGLYLSFDRPLEPRELAEYRELVKARAHRIPVKYILGQCEFMSIVFEVGPGVLIPRPETEHLVERALEVLGATSDADAPVVYDVGTGSGCIAVAIAKEATHATVVASDVSPEALAIAERNAASYGVSGRVTLVQGDLFDAFPPGQRADLVVSNPPYVTDAAWQTLPPEIQRHEPRVALAAGLDGLDCIRRLVDEAPERLKPGGRLLCEIGHGQADAVAQLVRDRGAYEAPSFHQDLAGRDRVLDAEVKGYSPTPTP